MAEGPGVGCVHWGASAGMALFTTALGLYGGVLWSGEFQGFIIHELVPVSKAKAI